MNKTSFPLSILTLIFCTSFFCTSLLFAENPKITSYRMELAKKEGKKNVQKEAFDYTIEFLESFKSQRSKLAKGQISKVSINKNISDFHKLYASAYLLCSQQLGVCKHFLDTILEVDIINSKINGKASCLNTLKLWKVWIDNDMEKRLSFKTKITDLNKVTEFNRNERPKYHKCKKTIEDIISDASESQSQFFKRRYSQEMTPNEDYLAQTIKYFKVLQKKEVDVYRTVGLN